jgi:hypothetical protein
VPECPGKFRWCSTKLHDFFKKKLLWKNGAPDQNNSCVFLDTKQVGEIAFELPKLAASDCQQKKFFACEVTFRFVLALLGHYFLRRAGPI